MRCLSPYRVCARQQGGRTQLGVRRPGPMVRAFCLLGATTPVASACTQAVLAEDEGPVCAIGPHLPQPGRAGLVVLEPEDDPPAVRGVRAGERAESTAVVVGEVAQAGAVCGDRGHVGLPDVGVRIV